MLRIPVLGLSAAALAALLAWPQAASRKPDYAIVPVPFQDVRIADPFWSPRLDNNRQVSIPQMLDHYEKLGRGPDLRLMEAACMTLVEHPDDQLRHRIEAAWDPAIARMRTRKGRWSSDGDGDMLGAGNFMEAAVACTGATGNRKLLDAAVEIADDLDAVFGPDKRHDISNHEGIKLGLVSLYRATGNTKYLRLAKFFLDTRGNSKDRPLLYGPYAQDQEPVKAQTRAVGHVVRAMYLYAPLTDLAALTNDTADAQASQRIWQDAVSKRMYLTGGFGSYRAEENFGDDYDLPNVSAWNEICGAYGNILWNHRLFLQTGDARYADVMERTLYNALLAGVSLSGSKFLYQSPLTTYAGFARQEWYGPNCCPPNVARLLAQLGSLVYAQSDQGLYVNLFVSSSAKTKVKGSGVSVTQETRYPWESATRIRFDAETVRRFAVFVRIPGWARAQPVPELLYHYSPGQPPPFTITVNGRPAISTQDREYARIDREWVSGDTLEIKFPMPVERAAARPEVADDRGMVAFERGPLVYCLERSDNPEGVLNLVVPDAARVDYAFRDDLLGGVGTLTGNGLALSREGTQMARKPATFTAVPYYAFGNRTADEMSVWVAREESKARVAPPATLASTSRATSSVAAGTVADNYPAHKPPTPEQRWYPNSQDGSGEIRGIQEQSEPVNSEDGSGRFLRLHPQSGSAAWVQYDLAKPSRVSSVEVYWKDDKQYCATPKSWRLMYQTPTGWQPVHTSFPFGVEKDKFNKVTFDAVSTAALRLEVELQPKVYKKGSLGPPDANYLRQDLTWFEGGLIRWRVN